MKLRSLCMVLCVISATGSLFSAERPVEAQKDEYLKFKLDGLYQIIGASEHGGMKFLFPKEDFMHKVITDAVPLNQDDENALNAGFARARVNGGVEDVPYTLETILFLAAIKYKKDKENKDVFVVKVRHQ